MYRLDDCMVLLTPYIKNIIKDGAVEEYDKISELFSNFLILLRYYAKKDLQPYYYFHKKPNVKIIYSPPHSGLSES